MSINWQAVHEESRRERGRRVGAWSDSRGLARRGGRARGRGRGRGRGRRELGQQFWPEEWRGVFDSTPEFDDDFAITFVGDVPRGPGTQGKWQVKYQGDDIGDFQLAVRYGFPESMEVCAANLREDLWGNNIMRRMADHMVSFSPTPYLVINVMYSVETYRLMQTWGWMPWGHEALRETSWLTGLPADEQGRWLGIYSHPRRNVFDNLGLPSAEELLDDD